MIHRCYKIHNCRFCIFISRMFGHPLIFFLHKNWKKISIEQVIRHMRGLNLEIVGGLNYRGWTVHDIDVIGDEKDIPILIERLERAGITNPVHLCDSRLHKHAHLMCLIDGLKVILFGNNQFRKA